MTGSPGTRIPPASVTVAVTVLSELPSARIDAGDSATVTSAAGPAANDGPPQHKNVASSASTPTINNRTRAINCRPAKRLPPQCLVSRNPPHHPRPARLRPTGGHFNPTAPTRPRTMSRPVQQASCTRERASWREPAFPIRPAAGSPATRISGPRCARGESVAGAAGGPATGTTTASMLDRWPTGAASTVRSIQWPRRTTTVPGTRALPSAARRPSQPHRYFSPKGNRVTAGGLCAARDPLVAAAPATPDGRRERMRSSGRRRAWAVVAALGRRRDRPRETVQDAKAIAARSL